MTTHFASNNTRRNSPSWCKPGMFTGISPTINGIPVVTTAYVRWSGTFYDVSFNVIETMHLRRDHANKRWVGETAAAGQRILIRISDTADPQLVDVKIQAFENDFEWDAFTWPNVSTNARPPWGTRPLAQQAPPEQDLLEAQILA